VFCSFRWFLQIQILRFLMQSSPRLNPGIPLLMSLLLALVIFPASKAGAGNLPVLSNQYKYTQGNLTAVRNADGVQETAELTPETEAEGDSGIDRKADSFTSRADVRLRKKLSAKSAIVLDALSGTVLYAYNADSPRQPASTIKVLTGLIAIERLNDHDRVIASRKAARMPRSKVYLKPGRTYQANDLINAVLLASANDASVALAEKIGGNESSFARLMTQKARRIGAQNTVCKTASGLTKRGQHTTARDLAMVFNHAMHNQEFAKRMKHTKVTTSFGKILWNHNKALWRIAGAEGGKTGYTRAARQTYVGKFERKGRELIVAIMGSETMWDDISRLVRHGFTEERQLARTKPAHGKDSVQARLAKLRERLKNEYANDFNTVRILSDNNKLSPQLSL
jgi:D-alanyl-D-alanine carboxypeptidase (penicillin-binding protein 5/6)